MFDKEQKRNYTPDPFKAENMEYNELEDKFICANNRELEYSQTEAIKQKMDTRQKGGYINQRTVRDVN